MGSFSCGSNEGGETGFTSISCAGRIDSFGTDIVESVGRESGYAARVGSGSSGTGIAGVRISAGDCSPFDVSGGIFSTGGGDVTVAGG